mmetsp:Transcript_56486/g.122946  ORF Transcript_56486/g.122946 Transcript_56486/m.122946 type:complete len:80 (+) Transcript_56486:1205-1444(+)
MEYYNELFSSRPLYDPSNHNYYFKSSRMKEASVKNFQFEKLGCVIMNFGRFNNNEFILDFNSNFSTAEAMLLGLSTFYK